MILRDSTAERPPKAARVSSAGADSPGVHTHTLGQPQLLVHQAAAEALQQPADSGRPILKRKALATQHDTSRATRRADAARAHRLRQEVAAEGQVAGWLTRLALQPSSTAASAHDRVKAIRERLAGR